MLRAIIRNIFSITLIGIIIPVMLQSCEEECTYKPRSFAGVDFHSVVDGIDNQWPVDSLSVSGLGREDSLLYSNRRNIRSISLPMNGSAEESGFIFVFNNETDTIWFSYKVIPWFLSMECGFVLNFELIEARHTVSIIDSVVIVTREITSFDETNIRIYH
jgi:hypothetical protein